ncbi:MAG TPA: von Willebrand factor type A domain-containing protein, partial [Myxococcota bacterium]
MLKVRAARLAAVALAAACALASCTGRAPAPGTVSVVAAAPPQPPPPPVAPEPIAAAKPSDEKQSDSRAATKDSARNDNMSADFASLPRTQSVAGKLEHIASVSVSSQEYGGSAVAQSASGLSSLQGGIALGTGAGRIGGIVGGTGAGYGAGEGTMGKRERPAALSDGGTFKHAGVNPVVDAREDRFSTFAVDVDSASWMYARRFLKMGRLPNQASVRVEEMVNAMHYDYEGPKDGSAFAIHVDAAPSPFTRGDDVVRVALQGKRMTKAERKPAAITFLVDVSGSMHEADRLPWAKEGMHMAIDALRDDDKVAIVTYAGATRL